jgi:ribonuclease J
MEETMTTTQVRAIPLGGVGEVGRNMWALECGDEIVILDCGVMFPDEEMLGIDLVLPDISYLRDKTDRIRGILLSHGHEDHIGAVPYLLKDLGFPPIYGSRLTLGLLHGKLKEHRLLEQATLVTFQLGEPFAVGSWTVEPFAVAHSIPDAAGFGITTPAGLVVYLTDWKLDHTPALGRPTDVAALSALGQRRPVALLTDCVRVESPGYTPSEQTVGESFDQIFAIAPGRIIVATFASNISRVQQVIESAEAYGRKVVLLGRSMERNSKIALDLGYLKAAPGTLIRPSQMAQYDDDQIAVVCTGSQGEPMAVLNRLANRDHAQVRIQQGDTVVLSATPIPGNETSVSRVINNLFRLGAEVIYGAAAGVHVSGHAAQEELRFLLAVLRPVTVVPFHGEYRHMVLYRNLAQALQGLAPAPQVLIPEPGGVLAFDKRRGAQVGTVPVGLVFVDGNVLDEDAGVEAVIRDRQLLAKDGMLLIVVSIDTATGALSAGPDVVSRGFSQLRQNPELLAATQAAVREALATMPQGENGAPVTQADLHFAATKIKERVAALLQRRTRRHPMVLPLVLEV